MDNVSTVAKFSCLFLCKKSQRVNDIDLYKFLIISRKSVPNLPQKQVQALKICLSRETLNVVETLGLSTDKKKDQLQIIVALKQYVDGQVNEMIE